jgi:UDP-N-acetylmuramyl tripeptide synthase
VCSVCGARFEHLVCFYGHLGHYRCPQGHQRPAPTVSARRLEPHGFDGTDLTLATPAGELAFRLPLPGLYNVYNALAAVAGALALGVPPEAIRQGMSTFSAAFGRLERVALGDRALYLVLAKNPVGMNEALRTLLGATEGRPSHLLLALNDLDADGRDVSWIWDADFELLAGRVAALTVSGRRAEDLALRLKYAGVPDAPRIEPDLAAALDAALATLPPGETLYAVLTYTAMLALRRVLTRRGHLRAYWEHEG